VPYVILVFEALVAWQQSDQFSESERVALEYAEAVTLCSGAIEERLMERLKEHFEDDAIIELTALIAFQNLSSKFNSALGVPPQGFCRIPPREE
jgi:alkylhydroperoxidase family enzyme